MHTHDLIKPLCLAGSRIWRAQSARHRLRFQTCSRPDSQTSKSVRKKGAKDKKEKGGGGGNDSDSGDGLNPVTWQMACHALTN